MEEGQVTVDGATHLLPQPFLVVATQNPWRWRAPTPSRKRSVTDS